MILNIGLLRHSKLSTVQFYYFLARPRCSTLLNTSGGNIARNTMVSVGLLLRLLGLKACLICLAPHLLPYIRTVCSGAKGAR